MRKCSKPTKGKHLYTLEINMEPQNGGLEDHFPFQLDDFMFHVSFPGCRLGSQKKLAVFLHHVYQFLDDSI